MKFVAIRENWTILFETKSRKVIDEYITKNGKKIFQVLYYESKNDTMAQVYFQN